MSKIVRSSLIAVSFSLAVIRTVPASQHHHGHPWPDFPQQRLRPKHV